MLNCLYGLLEHPPPGSPVIDNLGVVARRAGQIDRRAGGVVLEREVIRIARIDRQHAGQLPVVDDVPDPFHQC